ncbi:MAG: transposase zinc-binding domain-containing protein [Polyangiales bacterium]
MASIQGAYRGAGGLLKFVAAEFDAYLQCGILEHGLVHLACGGCGHEMVMGFSCKRRGFSLMPRPADV